MDSLAGRLPSPYPMTVMITWANHLTFKYKETPQIQIHVEPRLTCGRSSSGKQKGASVNSTDETDVDGEAVWEPLK